MMIFNLVELSDIMVPVQAGLLYWIEIGSCEPTFRMIKQNWTQKETYENIK